MKQNKNTVELAILIIKQAIAFVKLFVSTWRLRNSVAIAITLVGVIDTMIAVQGGLSVLLGGVVVLILLRARVLGRLRELPRLLVLHLSYRNLLLLKLSLVVVWQTVLLTLILHLENGDVVLFL